MILNYYKLAEQPFGVTPDPRFMYMSPTHREAAASVLYAVRAGRGFTAVIAEPGMGKTTVIFNLLQQLGTSAKTAFLFQAQDTPINFLRNLLADLGVEDDGHDLVRMQVKLNECLLRETSEGKYFVVVIDEAQNLGEDVLEVVRMLSNFETSREKLMHIILAGQPQLAEKLSSPELTQLRQRISIVARLKPFDPSETRAFIEHRLRVAGYRGEQAMFTDRAYGLIAEYSGGIPRNINNICFNAMGIGCATQHSTINAAIIEEVLRDLDLAPLRERVPVVEYTAPLVPPQEKAVSKLLSVFPEAWRLRVGLASFLALLAGIGLTVLAKNTPVETSAAVKSLVRSAMPLPAALSDSSTNSPATDATLSANQSAAQPAATDGSALSSSNAQPVVQSELIVVGSRDTLYQICWDNFGRYDDQVVKMIRELNPGLANPRHLHVGQELRIPTLASLEARITSSPQGNGMTSAVEAKKP
jgi:general secretion pathway protein A